VGKSWHWGIYSNFRDWLKWMIDREYYGFLDEAVYNPKEG
jgi:hypothetical protein